MLLAVDQAKPLFVDSDYYDTSNQKMSPTRSMLPNVMIEYLLGKRNLVGFKC